MRFKQRHPEIQLVAILGYRAGLRLPEILGLRLSDFVDRNGIFELQIAHTKQRRLKTFASRRILPLHVLLSASEQTALRDWLCTRSVLPRHPDSGARAFGAPISRGSVDQSHYESAFKHLFSKIKIEGANFSHFRHSFASFLLLNLLLPDEESETMLVRVLRPSVSWGRSRALKEAFLGKERIGQASLHAVSQALGHTGIHITLRAYQHLLDVALDLNVCRAAVFDYQACSPWEFDLVRSESNAYPPEIEPPVSACQTYRLPRSHECAISPFPVTRRSVFRRHAGAGRDRQANDRAQQASANLMTPFRKVLVRWPDWSVIWTVVTQTEEASAALRRAYGITLTQAREWQSLSNQILPRFILNMRQDGAFTIPLGAAPQYDLNQYWLRSMVSKPNSDLRRAIGHFLGSYDRKNGFGRVASMKEAQILHDFLTSHGVWEGNILLNAVKGYLQVPAKKTGRPRSMSSKFADDFHGYPTLSFIAGETKEHVFGQTVEITRRFRRERKLPPGNDKPTNYDEWTEAHVPLHRHAIYAIKFFLIMFALRHRIGPNRLPHGNSVAANGGGSIKRTAQSALRRRHHYTRMTKSIWAFLNGARMTETTSRASNDNTVNDRS